MKYPVSLLTGILIACLPAAGWADQSRFQDQPIRIYSDEPAGTGRSGTPDNLTPRDYHSGPDSLRNRMATTITREDIRESGITRLHELVTLMDHWNGYTVNGQDLTVTTFGLSPYEGSGWTLLIDEQKIDLNILNWQHLNQAPVSIQQIDRVIVIETPRLYQGHFADRGIIHIITSGEHTGWMADGRLMAGNEINDPGPYEFTGRTSPNEERVGPDLDLRMGYQGKAWFFQASISTLTHRTTDTPIEQRIKDMLFTGPPEPLFETPEATKRAGYLRSGYRGESVSVILQAGSTRHRDILFFRPYGRDIPLKISNRFLGTSGIVQTGQYSEISLRMLWQEWSPGFAPGRGNIDLDLHFRRAFHQVRWNRTTDRRLLEAGAGMERTTASGAFNQDSPVIANWHYYHKWHETLLPGLQTIWDVHLSTDGSSNALKSTLYADWDVRPGHRIRPSLSYSERMPSETGGLWYWVSRGYHKLDDLEIPNTPPDELQSATLLSADLDWFIGRGGPFNVHLGSFLRQQNGIVTSSQRYRMIRPHQWFEHDEVSVRSDGEAITTGFHGRLQLQTGERLHHMLFLGVHHTLSANEPMRRALDQIPSQRLRFTTSWSPVHGFALWTGFRWHSSVTWSDFEEVDGVQYSDQQDLDEGRYHMKSGPVTHLDLGGRKSLWSDRIELSLFIKNLLNRPYFEYPVGTDHDLTFYIQVELNL